MRERSDGHSHYHCFITVTGDCQDPNALRLADFGAEDGAWAGQTGVALWGDRGKMAQRLENAADSLTSNDL